MFKIKTGDEVIVLTGKDKGKKGKVTKLLVIEGEIKKLVVDGLNVVKKHLKPSQKMPKGGIVDQNKPLAIGNVMLVCPSCKKPSRIGVKMLKENKVRFCKKCQEVIDKK